MLEAIPEFQRESIKAFLLSYHLQTCKEAISLKSFICNALKAWQQNKFGMREAFNCNERSNELVEKSIHEAFEVSKKKYNLVSKCEGQTPENINTHKYILHSPPKQETRKSYLTPTLSFLQRAIDKVKIPSYIAGNMETTVNPSKREASRTTQKSPDEFNYTARNYKSHIRLYKDPAQGDENNLLGDKCSSFLQSSDSPKCGNQTTMLSSFFNKSCRRRSTDAPLYSDTKVTKEEKSSKASKLAREQGVNMKLTATQMHPSYAKSPKTVEKPQVITKEGMKIPFLKDLKVHSSMKNIQDDGKKGYSTKLKDHCWKSAKMFETRKPKEVQIALNKMKHSILKNASKVGAGLIPKLGYSKSQNKNYATEHDPIHKHYMYKGMNIDSNLESIFDKMNYAQLASVRKTHLLYATHINQLKK